MKRKPKLLNKKTFLNIWWYTAGLNHCNVLKLWKTITVETYGYAISKVNENPPLLCTKFVGRRELIIFHNNARHYVSFMILHRN